MQSNMYTIEMHSEFTDRDVSEETVELHDTSNSTKKYKEKQFYSILSRMGILESK